MEFDSRQTIFFLIDKRIFGHGGHFFLGGKFRGFDRGWWENLFFRNVSANTEQMDLVKKKA